MSAVGLLNMVNAMILLPDKPLKGDFIALDWGGDHPSDFTGKDDQVISWFYSQVIGVDGNNYQVSYDDGSRWYEFKEFGTPKPSKDGLTSVYPALPPI